MSEKIRIINQGGKKSIAIINSIRFSRLPMIGEYVEYGDSLLKVVAVLHGYTEDVLYVEPIK